MQDSRVAVCPVYVDTKDKIRLLRSLNREENPDCDEICRRFQTDKKDFSLIKFPYTTIDNNNPGLDERVLRAFFDNLIN